MPKKKPTKAPEEESELTSNSLRDWKLLGCIAIPDESSMRMGDISDLTRAVLDRLPVQVFIKTKEFVPGSGRKYLYLNRAAREIPGWSAEEAESKFDGAAFTGGTESHDYKRMFETESETMDLKLPREGELSWTAPTKHGTVLHVNKTREIPIVQESDNKVIGLCAIAQDLEANAFIDIHNSLRKTLKHEYGNHINNVNSKVTRAIHRLESAASVGDTESIEHAKELLDEARGFLRSAKRIAECYFEAWQPRPIQSSPKEVGEICAILSRAFEPAPFELHVGNSEKTESVKIQKPWAVIGLLLDFIQNAVKHSTDTNHAPVVRLRTRLPTFDNRIVWNVQNYCPILSGKPDLSPGNGTKGAVSSTFSIRELLRLHFGIFNPSEVIEFCEPDKDGWVTVKLSTPEVV